MPLAWTSTSCIINVPIVKKSLKIPKRYSEAVILISNISHQLQTHRWSVIVRRVWKYHRGNQNPFIEEEQTKQWPKEKVQKDKQRSTKHTYKTKDRVTQTSIKTGRVNSSCSTSDTHRVNLVTNCYIRKKEKHPLVYTYILQRTIYMDSYK
jgi:hypothetical protein